VESYRGAVRVGDEKNLDTEVVTIGHSGVMPAPTSRSPPAISQGWAAWVVSVTGRFGRASLGCKSVTQGRRPARRFRPLSTQHDLDRLDQVAARVSHNLVRD
jgi:hypothetical protein